MIVVMILVLFKLENGLQVKEHTALMEQDKYTELMEVGCQIILFLMMEK